MGLLKTNAKLAAFVTAGLFAGIVSSSVVAQELSWGQKMFEQRSHDFGVVARGSDAVYRFKLTNIYKETVHIASVRTTCGCTAAEPSNRRLASRETAYIQVKMDTLRFTHRKDSNVIVTFDAPSYAEVYLPITSYIRTDVVLTPGGANFGNVDQGTEATKKVAVAYAGRNDWTIKEVRPGNDYVTGKVVETYRAGSRVDYDLYVTLKPDAPAGEFRTQLTLVTDDQSNPYVPVLVEANVEADFTVTPSIVSLGILHPGESKTVNVVVKGKKPFKIAKLECEQAEPSFKVRLPVSSKTVQLFPLTVMTPSKAGTFSEVFRLTIEGHPQPVTFKAYGKVEIPEKVEAPSNPMQ